MKRKMKEEVVDHKPSESSPSERLSMQLKANVSFESEGKCEKRKQNCGRLDKFCIATYKIFEILDFSD